MSRLVKHHFFPWVVDDASQQKGFLNYSVSELQKNFLHCKEKLNVVNHVRVSSRRLTVMTCCSISRQQRRSPGRRHQLLESSANPAPLFLLLLFKSLRDVGVGDLVLRWMEEIVWTSSFSFCFLVLLSVHESSFSTSSGVLDLWDANQLLLHGKTLPCRHHDASQAYLYSVIIELFHTKVKNNEKENHNPRILNTYKIYK